MSVTRRLGLPMALAGADRGGFLPGLEVSGIGIDEPETAGAARKILAGRHLPWTQVLLPGGQDLWDLSKVVEQWEPRGRE